ncbi:rod shape-determining protein [Streptomyces sp. NPDC057740]|uniref:rod shape-determining protein n=1 Tax=Streptomyces sp. NPDC057740 TaxID=3346234 RepID=UPI00369E48D9
MTGTDLLRTGVGRHRPWPACRRCCGIALDMGGARTRAWIAGKGVVVDVPTVAFPGAGAVYPVRRGTIVDAEGCARMLERLLAPRVPRLTRPLVIVTTPVLDGVAYRAGARAAVAVLEPCGVLTVPGARAVAVAAGADLSRPLLVVDIGAQLTEAVLLSDGAVTDAHHAAVGTNDLDTPGSAEQLVDVVGAMLAEMLRQDRTSLTVDALHHGILLAGGGALRPEITYRLTGRLHAPLRVVPAPHTAAVRGAARLLQSAQVHPSTCAPQPPVARPD